MNTANNQNADPLNSISSLSFVPRIPFLYTSTSGYCT